MAKRVRSATIRIYNKSAQLIPIQIKPPGGDFFLHEQQIRIPPGKSVTVMKDHILLEQVMNLKARGMLQITNDSEAVTAE